jgi:uncharacterized repeat protein (TIGR02543 family)
MKSASLVARGAFSVYIILCVVACPTLTLKIYTVTYNGNGQSGGDPPADSKAYLKGATVIVLDCASLVKEGYTFAGWNTQPDGEGSTYQSGTTLLMPGVDLVLYAVWSLSETHGVTYDGGGSTSGSPPVDSKRYVSGEMVTVLGPVPPFFLVRYPYQFAGWNTRADGSGSSYAEGASFVMGNDDVTLYPVWIDDEFRFTSYGTNIVITSWLGTGDVTIPGGVTEIGMAAFAGSAVTDATIAGSVARIGTGAFQQSSLRSVRILDGARVIGGRAFHACGALKDVYIPASVTDIGQSAFGDCSALTGMHVDPASQIFTAVSGVLFDKAEHTLIAAPGVSGNYVVPGTVTAIAGWAFEKTALTGVEIPSSVRAIGGWAFNQCSGLSSVSLQPGLASIGDEAFARCGGLTGITIPATVTGIVRDAFRNSPVAISVDAGNQNYCAVSGSLLNKKGTEIIEAPSAAGSFVIPSGVSTIGDGCFYDCAGLTAVTIPPTVAKIGSEAFLRSGLRSVTIPSSVTIVSDDAFWHCESLLNVTVQALLPPALGSGAFGECPPGLQIHVPQESLIEYYRHWNDYWKLIVSP